MLQTRVKHPRIAREYDLDFYVAARHDQPLLGLKACRQLELLKAVDENICEVHHKMICVQSILREIDA